MIRTNSSIHACVLAVMDSYNLPVSYILYVLSGRICGMVLTGNTNMSDGRCAKSHEKSVILFINEFFPTPHTRLDSVFQYLLR